MEPVRGQLACISLRILDAPGSSDPTPSSTSPDIIKTQRDSDQKRRGNPFLWKNRNISYWTNLPNWHRHVSTQFIVETHLLPGEKSGNFLRDGQLPGQETKKNAFKHTHCERWSQFSRSQDTRHKSLGQGTYKRKPEQTKVYKKGILTISVGCQIKPPTNTFLTMGTLILCVNF